VSYLLDTNVVSELRKRPDRVDPGVLDWARGQRAADLYISVVTILEVELGVARVERRDREQGSVLRAWLESGVLAGFAGRILPVDIEIARRAAHLHVPDPRPERDAYIAATADIHGMTVVTRRLADFIPTGIATLSPWSMG
jgi:predicted nucleic acid-binding protein